MVQKRAPHKPSPSQLEPKIKNLAKSERRLPSHQDQDIRNKGRNDLRKKMKKSGSIKVSDLANLNPSPNSPQVPATKPSPHKRPSTIKKSSYCSRNYMKPTSSSDARKEHLRVRLRSSNTVDKNQRPNPCHLQRPSPSSVPGLRPSKVLSRKSSLKPVRPLMKMSSGIPSFLKTNASRATCSSIMKDSTFPKAFELSPGATESQGTSVMKVCLYTFCTLNGHRQDEHLPPLKCFLSARRRLIKTQKSMKLRGLSSFRRIDSEKGKEEMDMVGQTAFDGDPSVSAPSPLIEEVGNNFFVEIYAKPQAEIIPEHVDDVECSNQEVGHVGNPKYKPEIPLIDDDKKTLGTETQEDGRLDITRLSDQSYSETSLEDNWDQYSYVSISDMEVPKKNLKCIECDYEVEPQDTKKPPCSAQDHVEGSFGCYMLSDSAKNSESFEETQYNEKAFEATDTDWDEEKTPFPLFIAGYSGIHPSFTSLPGDEDAGGDLSLETDNYVTVREEASVGAVADLEPNDEGENLEDECPMEAFAVKKGPIQNPLTDTPAQNYIGVESSEGYEQQSVLEMEGDDYPSSITNIADAADMISQIFLDNSPLKEDNNEIIGGILNNQAFELVVLEGTENMVTSMECLECSPLCNNVEDQSVNDEADDAKKLMDIQLLDYVRNIVYWLAIVCLGQN